MPFTGLQIVVCSQY